MTVSPTAKLRASSPGDAGARPHDNCGLAVPGWLQLRQSGRAPPWGDHCPPHNPAHSHRTDRRLTMLAMMAMLRQVVVTKNAAPPPPPPPPPPSLLAPDETVILLTLPRHVY